MGELHPDTLIRALVEADYSEVIEIVAGLPDWFDDAASISVPIDIKHQRGFVAERQGKVVGFMTLYVAEGKLNIGRS